MSEDEYKAIEDRRIREEHAALVKAKAKADELWHEEVRATLNNHGTLLQRIDNQLAEDAIGKLKKRIEDLESFKTKAVAYWTAGSTVLIAVWEVLRHLILK